MVCANYNIRIFLDKKNYLTKPILYTAFTYISQCFRNAWFNSLDWDFLEWGVCSVKHVKIIFEAKLIVYPPLFKVLSFSILKCLTLTNGWLFPWSCFCCWVIRILISNTACCTILVFTALGVFPKYAKRHGHLSR